MPDAIPRRGLMMVLSSPSGAGKSTLARALLDSDPEMRGSISVTTRPRRSNELEGRDYIYVDVPTFERMIEDGAFLEYARVFGNLYGTPREPVEAALAAGRDVLFDIDWQGARQIARTNRPDLVTVFVLPPSAGELARRLSGRATDAPDVISRRMRAASDELSHYGEYDYVVVNRDVQQASLELAAILIAERLRKVRQVGIGAFIDTLKDGLQALV